MTIEQFIAQSEGKWRSMRSTHSLAFQQFEDIVSYINIRILDLSEPEIQQYLTPGTNVINPFRIEWEGEPEEDKDPNDLKGYCILIPIPETEASGKIIRSKGYTEKIRATSSYQFLSDGTFTLETKYEQSIVQERIWFLSENVRCRSSVIRTSKGSGIIQTSFTSEIKLGGNQ